MARSNAAIALIAVASLFAALASAGSAAAGPQFVVALGGYDAVAYHTEGRATIGRNEHAFHWNGATWLFASDANRDAFAADPAAFAPQYDGYCAYAAAKGYKAPGSPLAWRVVDRKLYVNFSDQALELWLADVPSHVAASDRNWPRLNGY